MPPVTRRRTARPEVRRPSHSYTEKTLASGREARLATACVVAYSCAQMAFLAFGSDWDISGDEAEYWAWSRRLDWSYYAKGPVIALILRLATELAGGASLALTGSMAAAV